MSGIYTASAFPELNEINSLEYGMLKIPYELLNKKFRASQKTIDQHNYYFKKEYGVLEEKCRKRRPTLSEVAEDLNRLCSRVSQFQTEFCKSLNEEIGMAESSLKRAESLTEISDATKADHFTRVRLDRFIANHLLRAGYFETAQQLTECTGLDMQGDKYVFHIAKQVEDSLARKDLSICLNWILDNRSKLHRLNSVFETEVRIQQCVELIRNGRRLDAVNFARNYFGHLPATQWKQGNLLILFGLLGFGDTINTAATKNCGAYQRLLSDERYDELIEMFRRENSRIFQISSQSAFSACLHTGLAAHKTPHCRRNKLSKCIVCSRLYDLAEGLPVAHEPHSKLICAQSGEPLNEENQPMMLSNGRVYGENTIRRLINEDNEVRCPRTGNVCSIDEVRRVFVL